jgi:predicted ATP-grasp superfamily ATP-dependent carboligase
MIGRQKVDYDGHGIAYFGGKTPYDCKFKADLIKSPKMEHSTIKGKFL